MPSASPIIIVGATNLIAPYLIKRMRQAGRTAEVITRRPITLPDGFTLTQMDLMAERGIVMAEGATVISLIPLWLFAQSLSCYAGVKAIIAVGSTSLFSKAGSTDPGERGLAASLETAEKTMQEWSEQNRVPYTLLRPTMIYDGHNDKNIARMAQYIRRFRFLPLAAPAKGLRQPIHADDAARAVMSAIDNEAAHGRALNIAGGEVLNYRAMTERVFAALGMSPRLLMLPPAWLAKAFDLAKSVRLLDEIPFSSAIFRRMNEDLVFDVTEGLRLLDYQPRQFEPAF